jgi:NitT/TauT family transport system substrate-binding protein
MKRFTKVALVLVVMAMVVAACSSDDENEVIRLGFEGGLCQAAIPLAHILGFFEDEGLETEIVVTGDLVSSRDSLMAGHIDTVAGMLAGWFVPVANGMDIRFTQGLHTGCATAFVLVDSDITAFEAGMDIAVSGAIGGAFHNIALRFIYREGFSPEDFTWRDFPAAEAVIALQNGSVQVAVIPDHVGKRFVEDGVLRAIRSLDDPDFADETCCVLGLTGAFIDANPGTAERITRAVYRASRFIGESEENKREAVTLLIDAGYLSAGLDIDFVVGLMSNWRWGISHADTEQTLWTSIAEYQTLGVLDASLAPEAIHSQVWNPLG